MARPLETDPINQLEENLECTVCLEVLTDPRTLPCCHSFCKDCLERIVQTLRDQAPRDRPIREFPCPNCRATFTLDPDKHVADMPRNHFICNMVKVAAVLDRGIGVPCSHNCSQSYSVARCVTCEKFLCRECLTDHNKYRANNGHSVLTMEELSKPENRKKINDKMYCNEHSGMELKIYCETCDQLICRDCMDFNHDKQGHSCVLVKDVANNYKELLATNSKAMEDALTEGNVFLQRLTLTIQQLDRDAENAKIKITQRKEFVVKKVIEMLDQKAESLCTKVDEFHKCKRTNLDRQEEETKLYVENIKTSVQLSRKLVDQGTEEEIISSQKMMLDNANNLLTNREEYFKAPIPVANLSCTTCADKEPINEEILSGLANSLGEVNEEKKDTATAEVIVKLSFNSSGNLKLVVYQGDITKESVDAIVNPANDRLQHDAGTALAIVKAGGRSIQDESDDIMRKKNKRLQPGEVELTAGGQLPCKFVVHAVCSVWDHHPPKTAMTLLYNAVINSLKLACHNGARSISIPAVSSGLYKGPVAVCAQVLFDAVVYYFVNKADKSSSLEEIHFVNIDSSTNRTFVQEMEKRFRGYIKREKVEAIFSKDCKQQEVPTKN